MVAERSQIEARPEITVFPFSQPTMLAPMEGVTHPTMRAIMAEKPGLGIVCTEFVRISRAPLVVRSLEKEVVKAPGVPLSVQVMGNEAEKMAEAASVVAKAGADVVDVNLGCPAPRVVRKGVGAAMLKDPALLFEVLSQMRRAVPGLLSAKMRAGFDDASGVLTNAKTLEAAGIDYLVVHPRRRCDFYEGVADWRTIRAIKETVSIPVVGNGDCWYAADALRMMAETGCDAVMIGRPALRNPWIFEQIADLRSGRVPRHPSGADLFEFLLELVERLKASYPGSLGGPIGKVKELLGYISRTIPDDRKFQREVLRLPSLEAMLEHSERVLRPLPKSAIDLGAHGELGLERSGKA
jgi:tRNA-dihydrouridine synthase B